MLTARPLVIGISGGTGSGKTSVTNRIVESLDPKHVIVLQHDSYYKDISAFGGASPSEINYDHPSSLETELLVQNLDLLKQEVAVEEPIYDFTNHRRIASTRHIDPKEIIIVEGILILADKALRSLLEIKIFVDTDADERLMRRIRRDMIDRGRSLESIIHQYSSTVKPMHQEFVEPSKQWADVIIPRGAENIVAIDMVVTSIKTMIEKNIII